MQLSEILSLIEGSGSLEALRNSLQRTAEHYGFVSFGFIDIGSPGLDSPFWMATSSEAWVADYDANGFVHLDPIIPVARRTNTPFLWSDVAMPARTGKRKSLALKIMEAARDYGMRDGLVIPFHFVDRLGRLNSSCATFHWSEKRPIFGRLPAWQKAELQVVLIYWAQRLMDLTVRDLGRRQRSPAPQPEGRRVALTDREKLVLEWAARGKTVAETGTILSISATTVESYVRQAMEKLEAVNKTQAAVRAIKLGLIDI